MGRAQKLIARLKQFNQWGWIGGSKTQKAAGKTEEFAMRCVCEIYSNAKCYKLSSQTHPDFFIGPASADSSIEEFVRDKYGMRRSGERTKQILLDWEKSSFNRSDIELVRLEVKTGKSNYILNDTFPPPNPDVDEVYVLLSKNEQVTVVTTSATMARECPAPSPSISTRYERSSSAVDDLQAKLEGIWAGTGIKTAARPTYSMDKTYAHHDAAPATIAKLFKKAGFED